MYVPTGHKMHEEAAVVSEYEPSRQSVHIHCAVAPTAAEYLPTPQSVHAAVPVSALYFPCAQVMHVPPFAPVDPMLHTQSAITVLPKKKCPESDGQAAHVISSVAPTAAEYLLTAHSVQVLSPEAPIVVEYFPVPQSVQTLGEEAPRVVEYLPAPQLLHMAEPTKALYFPAAHAVHVLPFCPVNPALHWQWIKSLLPCALTEFSGQAEQEAEPISILYVPATHKIHVCPSSPVAPALHLQLSSTADCGRELDCVGQA